MIQNIEININKKVIPTRIYEGKTPKYIFVTHHGMLSNKTSFRYFEKWVENKAVVISYDARCNGQNNLRASRRTKTYVNDLRDVVRWAKEKYPKIPIVTIGSSWGAAIVSHYAKIYGTRDTYKNVAWSIPYAFATSQEAKKEINKNNETIKKVDDKVKVKQTGKFGFTWRMLVMLFFNINTKAYVKIDLEKTANNKALNRLNTLNKPSSTPIKLFWTSGIEIIKANKYLKKIDKKGAKNNFLYIQSLKDSYLKPKKLKQLKKWTNNNGVKTLFLNEGQHAFQWETENNVNIKVFKMVIDFLKE